jgi:hypothetical protein
LRHAGLKQYFCRPLLRASGTNKSPQLQHLFRLTAPIFIAPPKERNVIELTKNQNTEIILWDRN